MRKALLVKLLSVTLVLFVLSSCGEEEVTETSSVLKIYDYYALTEGTKWTYTNNFGTTTWEVVGTKEFDGVTFVSILELPYFGGSRTFYIHVDDSEVYRMRNGFFTFSDADEMIILKSNEAEGTTWDYNPSFNSSARYEYGILSKGISHTVEGETYNNVIKVSLDTYVDGTLESGSGSTLYFALGIGMTEFDSEFSSSGDLRLDSYVIK